MRRLPLTIAALLVVVLTACTDGAQATPEPDEGALCESYQAVADAYADFQELDPSTASVDDYRESADTTVEALEAYLTLRGAEAADTELQLRLTLNDLATSLRQQPEGTSPEEAIDAVQPEIDAVRTALDTVGADLDCG
jgi:hypothetical protein